MYTTHIELSEQEPRKKKITAAGVETIRHPRRNVSLRLLKCRKLEQIFETVVIASTLAVLKRLTGLFFLRKGRLQKIYFHVSR